MSMSAPSAAVLIAFLLLTVLLAASKASRVRVPLRGHLPSLWLFFLFLGVTEVFSFAAGIWVLAALCFVSLKEYFTLVDIRWQDRWAVLGAYASIPFTIYFIQIDWYGMFIVSVPVYAFLVVPFLVALGGKEAKGSVMSVGVIDFGLFLFVYCVGHLGYLAHDAVWRAVVVVLAVLVSDLVARLVRRRMASGPARTAMGYLASAPLTALLFCGVSGWTGIPTGHSVVLGLLTPALASIGRFTIAYVEVDLGIDRERAVPGKGLYVDALRSFFYVSPVVFHYVRYFLT